MIANFRRCNSRFSRCGPAVVVRFTRRVVDCGPARGAQSVGVAEPLCEWCAAVARRLYGETLTAVAMPRAVRS